MQCCFCCCWALHCFCFCCYGWALHCFLLLLLPLCSVANCSGCKTLQFFGLVKNCIVDPNYLDLCYHREQTYKLPKNTILATMTKNKHINYLKNQASSHPPWIQGCRTALQPAEKQNINIIIIQNKECDISKYNAIHLQDYAMSL